MSGSKIDAEKERKKFQSPLFTAARTGIIPAERDENAF
jgi:hypothetical protein